jgi:hypothetical protein
VRRNWLGWSHVMRWLVSLKLIYHSQEPTYEQRA